MVPPADHDVLALLDARMAVAAHAGPPMDVVASAIVGPMGRCLVFCRRAGSEDSPHITQFFDDADAMAVSDYLRYFRDIEHIKALFSPTLFFPHALASDKDQALDLVCNRLIDAQVMEPEDRESIFRREEISSTEINPLVAMPHCILDSGDATKIAVFTTTSAVDWQYMDVQLIFVLLISRKAGLFKRTLTTIYRLTQDRDKVARLVETDDFGDFLEELFRLPSNAKPLRFNR